MITRMIAISAILLFLQTVAAELAADALNDCSCGYYDPKTKLYFTDSTIVYFNETNELPRDTFVEESYEHMYEKGWNTRYRQGAKVYNVEVSKENTTSDTSLRLFVEPGTTDHLVDGGAVQSLRRDMFYGSFRTLMRSPRSWAHGSALSMTLDFNDTQTINYDLMNPDDPSKAWAGMFVRNEFPNRDAGVNYTVLANSTNSIQPWDFIEYRVDWTEKKVNFYVAGKLFRSIHSHNMKNYPQTPAPLRFKHWSVGNWFTMQGPPMNRSVADVGWVRAFYNSSLTTDKDRTNLALRCPIEKMCSTENTLLRGSSPFTEESTVIWKQAELPRSDRSIPVIILIFCGSLSSFLLANALLRRVPLPHSQTQTPSKPQVEPYPTDSPSTEFDSGNVNNSAKLSNSTSSGGDTDPPTPIGVSKFSLGDYLYSQKCASASTSTFDSNPSLKRPRITWREFSDGMYQFPQHDRMTKVCHDHEICGKQAKVATCTEIAVDDGQTPVTSTDEITPVDTKSPHSGYLPRTPERSMTALPQRPTVGGIRRPLATEVLCFCLYENNPASSKHSQPATQWQSSDPLTRKPRVEYLAGLLAFSCMLVTGIQFVLTFSPASVDPLADPHYRTETWARKTVGSYFLNLVWIGPFLMTSSRFLVWDYLESGDLLVIAHKTVRRPFRLLIPILAIAMLEYFFMDSGAINWLEYLASNTWSTWQFTRVPNNFGYFVSEVLELAYLIPNAAPQITFNYCTGVLWTIPVQLQGSWVTLLGVIVIREIKTPWKRFGYYSFCILIHWYALSWGTYFYFGILLADLQINFRCRKWLHQRPLIYYPLVLLCLVAAFGGLTLDMVTQWTNVNYAAYEYGIHPDIPTGQPIMFTGAVGYPQYYVPKLNGIVFAIGLQFLIEFSPLVQKAFSLKALTWIFPHIFTIYLIHGFVFWSLGSTLFIYLAKNNFSYWKIVSAVFVSCYAALMLGSPILTPVISTLGKSVTANIWLFANETPSPRKPTLHPFPNNFLFVRQASVQEESPGEVSNVEKEVISTKRTSPFIKFVGALVAAVNPKLSTRACKPEVSLSRTGSVSQPIPRLVGWRTGGMSRNVAMVKRNNSISSRTVAW